MVVKQTIGVSEAARQLEIHQNTLRRWADAGIIQAIRMPTGARKFRVEEIERLRAEIYEVSPPRLANREAVH